MAHDPNNVVAMGESIDSARVAMIMVHGRGAAPRNILELVPMIDRPGVAYLAPAAENNTWYPYSFLTDMSRNEPHLSSALSALSTIVTQLVARQIPREKIVLLGFSQGACLASECAVRHAGRYGGVVALSGGIIGPPGTQWNFDGSFDGTPIFLGCSDVDPHVPLERIDETAHIFTQMGAAVTRRIYPGMGHFVNEDEIAATQDLLDRILNQ
ncbi:MAG: alpha/beta hydrolase [Vicinamibacterales bacterium]